MIGTVTGLDDALVAVAANLLSNALTSGAKSAWAALKGALIRYAPSMSASFDEFERDPSAAMARDIAAQLHGLGVDREPDVVVLTTNMRDLITVGPGAAAAVIGVSHGSIGGFHVHVERPIFRVELEGRLAFALVNDSSSSLVIESVEPFRGISSLILTRSLPALLASGERLSLLIEPRIGGGPPQVEVASVRAGVTSRHVLSLLHDRLH